jgi:hypothetical protein
LRNSITEFRDQRYALKNIFAKKVGGKLSYSTKNTAIDQRIVFSQEKPPFFHRKLAKIAENCDHNIGPWHG